jgi:flagellar hook-associated protein 2
MASSGSISLSGLLGGTAGQIDVTSLISNLMTAQSVPQTQLKDQLTTVQSQLSAYQTVSSTVKAVQTAAQALDTTAWKATAATSSSTSVVATSSATAAAGSTTFSVTQLASAQVTTVAADSSGAVVKIPADGITVTDGQGVSHNIALTSGSAADVAAAINGANIGVRASVIQTSSGSTILQVSSTKTGTANGFGLDNSNLSNNAQNVTAAQDAVASVGDPANGGYSVTSSSNTFTNLIPGVTFSANAPASNVTITVGSDQQSISDKVKALVSAAASAASIVGQATAQGAILQGKPDLNALSIAFGSAVSQGTSTGQSLSTYGIDLDSTGAITFDADTFADAYAKDPAGTQAAITGFVNSLNSTATNAVDPTTGTLTAAINSANTQTTNLNDEIDDWTTRLNTIQDSLTTKFTAMETALAKLQSQSTYLTSMFNSLNSSSSSSSSS